MWFLSFGFDVDLFRHVVIQPKGGMKARIRRQDVGERTEEPGWRLPFVPLKPE
ncbi:hypothetical protein HMPREF0454_01570 [Hafnia alvei ATCC 51873]|uniref:Uncharacterized protein n=1 Tax=Hafnia alvei ATCC 51873 TaxID=1002364 RepID=G9Y4Q6_HAFAL|nr:hypothetical protein HMPREF0454_01570 [Hafnia alvei ATCC 51873]